MKPIIAIDPGASGGIAWRYESGTVGCIPMPDGMVEQADEIKDLRLALGPNVVAVVEKVGTYMPGNSGPSAATFARHCGNLESILYCLAIPTYQVLPAAWQKAIGSLPKDKAERKRAIREEMQRRFPHLKVTLKTADALGILEWQIRVEGQK